MYGDGDGLVTTGRLCEACEYFSPAHVCMEKPTWGHCLKLARAEAGGGPGREQPLFTWADSHCDDFQTRQASCVPRPRNMPPRAMASEEGGKLPHS